MNEIGLVRLETARPIVFDRYRDNRQTGGFILIDRIENATLAAGMVESAIAGAARKVTEPGMLHMVETDALREFVDAALRELALRGVLPPLLRGEN